MKKLILMLVIFAGIQASGSNLIYNEIGFRHTPFIQSVCSDLGISGQTIIVKRTNMYVQGFCVKTKLGYVVFISNLADNKKETLAHELIHIWQDISGVWDLSNPTTEYYERFSRYTSKKAKKVEEQARLMARDMVKKF